MTRRGTWAIALLSCALLGASLLVILNVADVRAETSFGLPWPTLVPLYLLALLLPVAFEFRGEAHALGFSQVPLVLGAIMLTPWHQLDARVLAAVIGSVLVRRQAPLKVLFNASTAAVEVAAVAVGMSVVHVDSTGPALWAALFSSVVAGDVIGLFALSAVMRLAGVRRTRAELAQVLTFAGLASLVCTAIAIIVVQAVRSDPWTLILVVGLAGLSTYGYRSYRRLLKQQEVTGQLYDFVKDLGPLTADAPAAMTALEQIRVLLHARRLDLALSDGQGQPWRHVRTAEGVQTVGRATGDQVAYDGGSSDSPTWPGTDAQDGDRISASVTGAAGMLGILTAHGRLGNVRDFDRGDVRLLETIANELAVALDRGNLMHDLHRSATVDPLTGIPNLTQLTALVDQLIERENGSVILVALSVESFREVNDTLGHEVGDALLVEVVRRLQRTQPHALIGRIGGGRFAVAVAASVAGDPSLFGLQLRSDVEGGTQLGPVGTHIRVSMGVVSGPMHGSEAATLLRRAETAMYGARTTQGGPALWEPAYEVEGQRRLAVVTALREALATGAIGVAFQPKVTADGRSITGVEALARWTHPALGSVRPDEFIPLAEASGLIGPLTSTILRQSLTACQGWQRRAAQVGVAVNVSAATVLDAAFVSEVADVLATTGVAPQLLTLELTEGIAVGDPELAIERMRELRALGVRLSIDDFGTGYSSLTYLKSLPIDEVKVDKGFIDDVAHDLADQAVIRAVVDIAHTRGLRVVAEGVEQEQQHTVLLALGVDETQGYLYARPMPSMGVNAWLRRQESNRT